MFFFSLALFVAAVVAFASFGLNVGVDFKGGSVLELEFSGGRPTVDEITNVLRSDPTLKDREVNINPAGERNMIVRTVELTEAEHQTLLADLKQSYGAMEEVRFNSVGPAVGKELQRKSIVAIVIVLAAILLYILIVFRKLSRTLSLWAMNAATIVALLHDIIIPIGIFALLGHYANVQISAIFVAAILTILGYTVSDKVVIFDRVRENILRGKGSTANLGAVVHASVIQTLVRSINNTLTVLLSSLAIFLFGGESIRYFALALILGIALGAYSSIFVASPLLVWWNRKK